MTQAQIASLFGRVVLKGGGRISKIDADKRAGVQYASFKAQQKIIHHDAADRTIQELTKEAKELPRGSKRK
ncbi:MAG: hypothetical protein ACI92Z_001251 [Paracoccaceae bacterium]|jgi:hypothetical protein